MRKLLLCWTSANLLILSYPIFNIEVFAWFGFVPLFFAIRDVSKSKAFLLAYFTGVIFWFGTIYWLMHVTLLGLILLVLYLALYFGLFGLFFTLYTYKLTHFTLSIVILPAAWVFLEYLRSYLLTGFPWALLGYSQYLNLPIIQIADIVGVWGVSFLVMLVNVAILNLILKVKGKRLKVKDCYDFSILLTIFCIVCVLGYGFYKTNLSPFTFHLSPIKISVLQGNIMQSEKWDEKFRNSILERYETLTKEAVRDKPDLIIWPETAVPGIIGEEPLLLARILKLAKDVNVPLLVGAVTISSAPVRQYPSATATSYYNSAILISSDGKILQQYDKLHLVPFGEYVPFERHFPFLRNLIGVPIGDFTAGKESTLFSIQYPASSIQYKFAVLICFEDIIPELSHKFVKSGAQFLVNITNDAWFMHSSAPYQHVQASVFRAIENRVPVVRAANTGLSCFIDQNGRIYDKVSDGKKDIFVVGYRMGEIKVGK